jgi:hypothetical protein
VSAIPSPLKSVVALPMLDVPGCVSVGDWPATVTAPLRAAVVVFGCTCTVTVPVPTTAAVGLVTDAQANALPAVQLQADGAATLSVVNPPATPTDWLAGVTA